MKVIWTPSQWRPLFRQKVQNGKMLSCSRIFLKYTLFCQEQHKSWSWSTCSSSFERSRDPSTNKFTCVCWSWVTILPRSRIWVSFWSHTPLNFWIFLLMVQVLQVPSWWNRWDEAANQCPKLSPLQGKLCWVLHS